MRNIILFYCAYLLPWIAILSFLFLGLNELFAYTLFFYALIYHPVIIFFRLKSKNIITNKQFYKVFIPFWKHRWIREIYFEK